MIALKQVFQIMLKLGEIFQILILGAVSKIGFGYPRRYYDYPAIGEAWK
jgi:hypothetical protein